jgi:transposase
MEVAEDQLAEFLASMAPLLDERQRRMAAGAAARMLGRGGTTTVARLAHVSRNTVLTGAREVEAGDAATSGRVRREGGGRKRSIDKDANLLLELDDLVSPEARGDPTSPLRWTAESTYQLADALRARGFDIGPTAVRELLHEMGYSLRGTSKQKEGAQHVDRGAQFHHINDRAGAFFGR